MYFELKNSKAVNIDRNHAFFFSNHTRPTHPCYCKKHDCLGIYNILIDDRDGIFSIDDTPTQYFGHNRDIAKEGNCEFVEQWNGHECRRDFNLMTMFHTNPGKRTNTIAPIYLSEFFGSPEAVPTEDKFRNAVNNDQAFPTIIKSNSFELIEFSQSMPNNMVYRIESFTSNEWAVFKTQN